MKITFIGTGTMGSVTKCNTSVLVDDILFDIGMGTVKQIERLKIYTKSINYVIVSHFHADHFLDIPNFLIGRKIRNELENKLVFIGPVGLKNKVIQLMNFTHSDGDEHKYDNMEEKYNLEFVELKNEEEHIINEFKITAYSLNHGKCEKVNGYVLEKDNKAIAYACDTTICENLYKMCGLSDYMIADVTKLKTTEAHMGLEDYKELHNQYNDCTFFAVHRSDYDTSGIDTVEFPNDGDAIII